MYKSSSSSVSVNMNPVRGDREDEKRMLPCRYFVAGFCHRGSRCKFFHPNMHGRDPVIRVPELPSEFTLISQNSPYEGSQASGSRGLRPNRRMKTTLASPINSSPPRRSSIRDSYRGFMSPSSNAYAEYMSSTQYSRGYFRIDDDMDEFSDSADESKPAQNTVFNHIDWSEFLTPGVRPPPPTNVPDQTSSFASPSRVLSELKQDYVRFSPLSPKSYNKDMPPEGSQACEDEEEMIEIMEMLDGNKPKKMSAKEELKKKVKQIAQELADEPNDPVPQARSADSFFQDEKAPTTSGKLTTSPVKISNDEEEKKSDDESQSTTTTTVEA